MNLKTLTVTLAIIVNSCFACAQTSIHSEIRQVYNFEPHTLDSKQISQTSKILDGFWDKVTKEKATYLPALRQELGDFTNPRFFLFDGSMLLLNLSDTHADRKVALAAISHCDLRDVQQLEYFSQVHRLASLNEDTTAAAFHILESSEFKVFIVQHSLTLGQDYSLIYLLLPTDQNYWLQPAISRLAMEPDQTAQKSLLLLLWYAQTDLADSAIKEFSEEVAKPAEARSYAKSLLDRKKAVGAKQRAEALATTDESLRQKRRERLKAVSDEALYDLDEYTMLLLSKRP